MRIASLPAHMHASHPGLLGFDISDAGKRDLLKPRYAPFRPTAHPPPLPPPLPSGPHYSHNINPPTMYCGRAKRQRARSPSSDGRRWIRLDVATPASTQTSEVNDSESIELPNLPKLGVLESRLYDIDSHNFTIRKKLPEPPSSKFTMSNPHRLVNSLDDGEDEVPKSILYDTFAEKVDDLKKNGLL